MRPKPRWRGEGFLRGEEVVQKDIVHLLRGLGPWEGGEARLGTPVGEPLSRPKALGGSGQQKRGPVFVLGGLNRLLPLGRFFFFFLFSFCNQIVSMFKGRKDSCSASYGDKKPISKRLPARFTSS